MDGTRRVWALVILMILIGVAGLLIQSNNGFPHRFDYGRDASTFDKYRKQVQWPESNNHSLDCVNRYGAEQYCLIGNVDMPPTAAIIGDSHANHFYFGLSRYISSNGGNLLLLGAGACMPFLGIDRGRHPTAGDLNCFNRLSQPYEGIVKSETIKTVYISFHHTEAYRNDVEFIDRWGEIKGGDNVKNTIDAFARTVKVLEAAGKSVVLVYDMPDLDSNPAQCFSKRPFVGSNNRCVVDEAKFIDDFEQYELIVNEILSRTNAKVFYTHKFMSGNFPINSDGDLMYRDGTHLSMGGSLYFSDKFGLSN